jgi:hypothetical protein
MTTTPFYPIYTSGSVPTGELLLDHGANVHVKNKYGQTPLHVASEWGLPDMTKSLLKFGANIDAQDNDRLTPLQLALSALSHVHPRLKFMEGDLKKTIEILREHGCPRPLFIRKPTVCWRTHK